MNDPSRRGFLKKTALFVTTLPYLSLLARTADAYAYAKDKSPVPVPAGETPVSESDPIASALGFHQDAKKTDYARYPDRKKTVSQDQFCKSCLQYTALNEGWGKCKVITNGVVSAHGWCGSWTSKT